MATPESQYDTSAPVLVTGATGYVAGWLIRRLLEEGFTVHAAVRDPGNASKVGHLTKMASDLNGDLKLFAADLLDEGSYTEAMQDCSVVFHTASPFINSVEDPQRDLVDPALIGTRNVLETVNGVPSVRRVVVTSSCAAIYGDGADCARAPGGTLTEDIWNTTSSIGHNAYSYSKTLAERAAWDIAEAQSRWKLVTINPSLVLGPALNAKPTSESFNLIAQAGNGAMKSGVPKIEIGAVDVRDVAEAHMLAGFVEDAAGRYITSARTISFLEVGQALAAHFGDGWPFPRREMPKWLIWLAGPMVNKAFTRRWVSANVGHPWKADNSRSVRDLGMTYRPLDVAAVEMFQQMIDTGKVKKR
ncbi:MAG: NAD-dependent epimerase/dehydratase family protein [Rhodobacteraceae bacterium]|nr:NAD-dependent epimerase/dehydratase family protein [Paracoccaceae bacterium]